MIKKIKQFYSYYLILIGFIVFSVYFWSRFLRIRTSKELPLDLNIYSFFIILYICIIFSYILYGLLGYGKKNKLLENFIDWLFTPLKLLDKSIRNISIIKNNYEKVLEYIYPILEYLLIKTTIFYALFWIIPRLVLLTALFLDIFIFHQLHYKYQVIFFGLLLLFNRCFKYSLKNIVEEYLTNAELYIETVITKYVYGVHPSEWPESIEEDDEDDDIPPTMCLPLKIFIKFQIESIVYSGIKRDISIIYTEYAREYFWDRFVEQKYVFFFFKTYTKRLQEQIW